MRTKPWYVALCSEAGAGVMESLTCPIGPLFHVVAARGWPVKIDSIGEEVDKRIAAEGAGHVLLEQLVEGAVPRRLHPEAAAQREEKGVGKRGALGTAWRGGAVRAALSELCRTEGAEWCEHMWCMGGSAGSRVRVGASDLSLKHSLHMSWIITIPSVTMPPFCDIFASLFQFVNHISSAPPTVVGTAGTTKIGLDEISWRANSSVQSWRSLGC